LESILCDNENIEHALLMAKISFGILVFLLLLSTYLVNLREGRAGLFPIIILILAHPLFWHKKLNLCANDIQHSSWLFIFVGLCGAIWAFTRFKFQMETTDKNKL